MTTDECFEVLRQAKAFNCVRVILCGKEPLMREDIFDILGCIKEMGMDVELMTNGTLVDQSVVNKLHELGVKRVQVSLDGFNSTHDNMRGMKGCYDLARNAIKLFLDNDFKTSVNSVVLEENQEELPKLLENLMHDYPGLDELRLSRLIPTRFANPDYEYFETYRNAISNVVEFLKSLDRPFHIEIEDNPIVFNDIIPDRMKNLVIYTPCGVITHTIDVLNNGDVVFCVPMGSHSEPYIHGNILKDGLEKIISSIRKYENVDVDDKICQSCEHYKSSCLGGCRCVAYAYRQNEYLADPFCPKVRESIDK
jgi:radical SAM protein with 4Fe4S-binding SPASM domain